MISTLMEILDKVSHKDLLFMNYGHREIKPEDEKKREEEFLKTKRYFTNNSGNEGRLYFYLCETFEPGFEGKDVIEVSSGRGGGARFVAENYPISSYIGLDLSDKFIKASREAHKDVKNLSFVEGDAHKLPFEDNSADIVINSQAIHYYSKPQEFVKEVYRVLRPGGHVIFCGFMAPVHRYIIKDIFVGHGLEILSHIDITDNIIKSLDTTSDSKIDFINEVVPKELHPTAWELFLVKGTKRYDNFINGNLVYVHSILQKEV